MRGLGDQRKSECEHVYTTQHCCVAAQTRLVRRASSLQEFMGMLVGRRIAIVPGGSKRKRYLVHHNNVLSAV
jgi:hypothetical protein